jgi:hypothetical protein
MGILETVVVVVVDTVGILVGPHTRKLVAAEAALGSTEKALAVSEDSTVQTTT